MAYVITYGPIGREREETCETACEAVSIFKGLMARSEKAIMVSMHETGAFALEVLSALADQEEKGLLHPDVPDDAPLG